MVFLSTSVFSFGILFASVLCLSHAGTQRSERQDFLGMRYRQRPSKPVVSKILIVEQIPKSSRSYLDEESRHVQNIEHIK